MYLCLLRMINLLTYLYISKNKKPKCPKLLLMKCIYDCSYHEKCLMLSYNML